VDGVVAISENIANLLRDAGVDKKKIQLIHSGIEPARFRADAIMREETERRPVVGTLAVLEPRKGLRFLLEAAAQVKASGIDAEYRIAGSGPLLEELRKLTGDLGLGETVRFDGFVGDAARFLAEVDIFVMPSLFEGLGVSALEAMAAGKPVIATRVGGLTESVVDGVTGILVPPQDAAALAAAIARLVKDRVTAVEMGRRGAARVSESFTMERMARANEAFYYELLGSAS
jgi:glycosyltransferase involved in cell wall biosynthesis